MDQRERTQEQQLKEYDFDNINNHWINGRAEPWGFVMSPMQMGRMTQWYRSRPPLRKCDKWLLVWDVQELCQERWKIKGLEHGAQARLYDALTDGCWGRYYERMERGYKFDLQQNAFYGWAPHTEIFRWLEHKAFYPLTTSNFWNIVLTTKGVRTGLHSYKVVYWPEMGIVFIKVAKFFEQGSKNTEHKQDGGWHNRWRQDPTKRGINMDQGWDETASSSTAVATQKEHNEWGNSQIWADEVEAEYEDSGQDLEPDWDDDGMAQG
jgi:hypothetical protein